MSASAVEDPYVVLGVERTATPKEIKDAYRRQAKANHPDLHADKSPIEQNAFKQQFQRASAAFEILSDPQERAYYDKHGRSRRDANTTLTPIEKTILELFQASFNPLNDDVTITDYVYRIQQQIKARQFEANGQIVAFTAFLAQLKKMEGRFKRSADPENPLASMIKFQIAGAKNQLDAKTAELDHLTKCLDELKNYTYLIDKPAGVTAAGGWAQIS